MYKCCKLEVIQENIFEFKGLKPDLTNEQIPNYRQNQLFCAFVFQDAPCDTNISSPKVECHFLANVPSEMAVG